MNHSWLAVTWQASMAGPTASLTTQPMARAIRPVMTP